MYREGCRMKKNNIKKVSKKELKKIKGGGREYADQENVLKKIESETPKGTQQYHINIVK